MRLLPALCASLLLVLVLVLRPATTVAFTVSVDTTPVRSGSFVNVSFGAVPFEYREECWVGLVSPPSADVSAISPPAWPATPPFTATATVKYFYCNDDPNFILSGEGHREVQLINMREDVAFVLFTNGTYEPVARAKSAPVPFVDASAPQHAHLSRSADHTEMVLTWSSADPGDGATVTYGFGSEASEAVRRAGGTVPMPHTAAAKSLTYTAADMCGQPANASGWRDPGYIHTATMTGLAPGETVYYSFGSPASGRSDQRFFRASAAPGPEVRTSMLVFADMGASEVDGCRYHWGETSAFETAAYLTAEATGAASGGDEVGADMLLDIGDISYATGYSARWDAEMSVLETMASRVPLMVGDGNHERTAPGTGCVYDGNDSGGECGVPTHARFPMPSPNGNLSAFWWSLDQGSVHIAMINTELPLAAGSPQHVWLAADLAAVDRAVTPWVIVSGHRPLYHDNVVEAPLLPMEELLFENQVDLVLAGHVHYAQLTCPVYKGECVAAPSPGAYDAPVYAVVGNGGMGFSERPDSQKKWSKFIDLDWGYSRVTAHNSSVLELDYIYDHDDALHHRLFIRRSRSR